MKLGFLIAILPDQMLEQVLAFAAAEQFECVELGDTGYTGPVCIEAEDRACEPSLQRRQEALRQSAALLRNSIGGPNAK
jgi:hypothetical protein